MKQIPISGTRSARPPLKNLSSQLRILLLVSQSAILRQNLSTATTTTNNRRIWIGMVGQITNTSPILILLLLFLIINSRSIHPSQRICLGQHVISVMTTTRMGDGNFLKIKVNKKRKKEREKMKNNDNATRVGSEGENRLRFDFLLRFLPW